jgi:hypothetical protein
MRMTLVLVTLIATAMTSCERESGDSGPPPVVSTPTTRPRPSPSTAFLAVTQPATQSAADPLATPNSAVAHLVELMRKQDMTGIRAMLPDQPPADTLRGIIDQVVEQLNGGAKWEIVDTRIEGVAAIAIYRTTYPDGKQVDSPMLLVKRYDRWKVFLSDVNPKRLTNHEIESMGRVSRWAADRLDKLRGVTTKPTTTTTGTTTAPATGF